MKPAAFLAALVCAPFVVSTAAAELTFYDKESGWAAACKTVQEFDTSSENIARANEIGSPPGSNGDLGSLLTFDSANSGLAWSFQFMSVNVPDYMPRGLVFEDSEAGLGGQRNISIGDADGIGDTKTRSLYENDDWKLSILSGPPLTAFGFTLVGNNESLAESLRFYSGSVLVGELTDLATPGSGTRFIGIVSTDPITRILFDEDEFDPGPDHDDIAIRDFRFGEMLDALTGVEQATWAGIKALFR